MGKVFKQTDGSYPTICFVNGSCSGYPGNVASLIRTVEENGTAGTVDVVVPLAVNSTNAVIFFGNTTPLNLTTWNAGDWTLRLNITSGDKDMILEEVHVCRVNPSTCEPISSVGSATNLGISLKLPGVKTVVVSGTEQSSSETDAFVIVGVCRNANTMFLRTVKILPDQNIDTPL